MKFLNSPFEIKALEESGTIEGYGSVFGNVDSYGEVVMSGAFTPSLEEAKRAGRTIKMLWQHDPAQPIGIWDQVAEDGAGLKVKGRILKDVSPKAAEAYGLIKAGALDGLSIGYRTIEAQPDPHRSGVTLLTKLRLLEVSPVTFAANEEARVERVKSIVSARDIADLLQDAGISGRRAKAAAGAAWKAINEQSDEAAADAELAALIRNATARLAKGGR